MNISIYLGSRCNCNCKYCHRQQNDNEHTHVGKKLKQLLLKNKDNNLCVSFYGGEPTLYMKQVEEIVNLVPTSKFIITTNGTTIDRYTDFFNKHNFKVIISYDGENGIRNFDPFSHRIMCNNVSISSVLYHNHCSLKQLYKNINAAEQKCLHTLNSPPHIVHVTCTSNIKYGLSINEVYTLIHEEQNIIHDTIEDFKDYGILRKCGLPLVDKWMKYIEHNYTQEENYCCNRNSIKTDLSGNIWDCLYIREHNTAIGVVTSTCRHCNIRKYCGCACVHSIEHNIECIYYRRMITWFLHEYKRYKEEVDEIIRISKCNEFESSGWC